MSRGPLVSGIIIFLNAQRFLEEAIESVFRQTYDHWELLLVDDGSTDSSTEIASRCAAGNPGRVSYLEHPGHANLGMSASRNLGIRRSHGEYVAFLDSDDVWRPRKLEEQVMILEARPSAGLVYGLNQDWYSWSGPEARQDQVHHLGVPANTLVEPPALLSLFLQGRLRTPCPSDIMVRRSTAEHVGGFEDDFRGLYEDQAFLAKVYVNEDVFVAGEHWSRHRRHPDSFMATTRRAGPKHPAGLEYLGWLGKYLAANGIQDERVWKAFRKKRWRYRHPAWDRFSSWSRRPFRLAATLLKRAAWRVFPLRERRRKERPWKEGT